MSTPLIAVVFLLFVAAISIVVLRFSAVLSLMLRQQSSDRRELLHDIDLSHQRAHDNAMLALGRIYERSHQDQIEMFNRTMDMVHGPQHTGNAQPAELAVDDPRMDLRAAWQLDDDAEDGGLIYVDPTDELMPDPIRPPNAESDGIGMDESRGFAVTVRPGEGLL